MCLVEPSCISKGCDTHQMGVRVCNVKIKFGAETQIIRELRSRKIHIDNYEGLLSHKFTSCRHDNYTCSVMYLHITV